MKILDQMMMNGGDMSGSLISSPAGLDSALVAAIQAYWTGTAVGTLALQVSNDSQNWTTWVGSSTPVNGTGNFMWNLTEVGFASVQVIYTAASGSGSLSVTINGKE